jgi:hypothetical protein
MTPIGKLIRHDNFHLRMVAVRHAWAVRYAKEGDMANAAVQFRAARERLEEAREKAAT